MTCAKNKGNDLRLDDPNQDVKALSKMGAFTFSRASPTPMLTTIFSRAMCSPKLIYNLYTDALSMAVNDFFWQFLVDKSKMMRYSSQ